MKKFVIQLSRTAIHLEKGTIEIEANSREEAKRIFFDVEEYEDPYENVKWFSSGDAPDCDNFEIDGITEVK